MTSGPQLFMIITARGDLDWISRVGTRKKSNKNIEKKR